MVKRNNEKLHKIKDSIKLIEGILSHPKGKYTSVELQHESRKLYVK